MQVSEPKYKLIALSIATKIVDGVYEEGTKIYTRSVISSQYNVSSETARRAIAVLVDHGIVDAVKGSGVTVVSSQNAFSFIRQYKQARTVEETYTEIHEQMHASLHTLTDRVHDLENLFRKVQQSQEFPLFTPFQVKITDECLHLNKKVSDIQLWQQTSATVIAIKRNGALLMSPGANAELQLHDLYYFVGEEESYTKVKEFLYIA